MWPYLLWVPAIIFVYAVHAFLTVKNNDGGGSRAFFLLWIWATITPVWEIVSKYSKNLRFDAILFDCLQVSTYMITLTILGKGTITWQSVLGIVFAIIGLILLK